uniref:Uncharacterized protein n=2 Tax=Meloidogyne enterolobii TaxID=390850 RepID=A0A6V7UF80_MELEN|nr:unnamed protein product [Meloidogyne enterolobii]
MKISSPTKLKIKKTIKAETKKSFVSDLEEIDFEFPLNLFEDEKEFKLVEELKSSVPTDLPKKKIKKAIKETNLVEKFEKENDFDLPMDLFEAKEENKFEEKSYVSEENQVEAETIEEILFENMVQMSEEDEPVEDFEELRKEKANELGRMKNDSELSNRGVMEIKSNDFENSESELETSSGKKSFSESKDVITSEENFKEVRKEKANELSRMKIDDLYRIDDDLYRI